MLTQQTMEKLFALKLTGMAKTIKEWENIPDVKTLSFEEKLGLLIDREETERKNNRFSKLLKTAKLKQNASIENIDFSAHRGSNKSSLLALSNCTWIDKKESILITGPTGVGKSYIACALGQRACKEGYKVLYKRVTRLFDELNLVKAEGKFTKILEQYSKIDLLILDDWGLSPITSSQARDLMEIIDDRYATCATIFTSQIPVAKWHELFSDPTLADAILDRIVSNAHKLELKGVSMRPIKKD